MKITTGFANNGIRREREGVCLLRVQAAGIAGRACEFLSSNIKIGNKVIRKGV